jgi:hypothetical protein
MTRAVVQIDVDGNLHYFADGSIDFLIIDERCPRDRVYALSNHQVKPDVIDRLIGTDRIGRLGDMPGTEEAIRAEMEGRLPRRPTLTLISEEQNGG